MRMVLTRRIRRASVAALTLAIVASAATACGRGTADESADQGDATAPELIATTTIWADIVSNVACGEPVIALIPAGADPHSYEPSLRDRGALDTAALVVANGAGLETTTADLLDTVAASGTNVVEVATHVDLLDEHEADEADETKDDDDDHGHGDGDPHLWQDPLRVAGTLDMIASALTAAGYSTCADEYRATLVELDGELTTTLAAVERRILVTSHDSMEYFADRYDFEIAGSVIPSTSTLASSSAGDLADLADTIEALEVPAIFTDALESADDATALAERLRVEIVPLVTDALTDDAPTYVDMMRRNATLIAEALAS